MFSVALGIQKGTFGSKSIAIWAQLCSAFFCNYSPLLSRRRRSAGIVSVAEKTKVCSFSFGMLSGPAPSPLSSFEALQSPRLMSGAPSSGSSAAIWSGFFTLGTKSRMLDSSCKFAAKLGGKMQGMPHLHAVVGPALLALMSKCCISIAMTQCKRSRPA